MLLTINLSIVKIFNLNIAIVIFSKEETSMTSRACTKTKSLMVNIAEA